MWRGYRETDQFTDSSVSRYTGAPSSTNIFLVGPLPPNPNKTKNELTEPLVQPKPPTTCEKILKTLTIIMRNLLDWGVLILMMVLPTSTASHVVVYAVPFTVGVVFLSWNALCKRIGWVKIFPKVFEVGMIIINLSLLIYQTTSQPDDDLNTHWLTILSTAPLLLLAVISIAIKRPFTMEFTKEQVDESKWELPLFIMINYHVTYCWVVEFAVSICFSLLAIFVWPDIHYGLAVMPNVICLILALLFTAYYPHWARDRAMVAVDKSTGSGPNASPRAFGDIL